MNKIRKYYLMLIFLWIGLGQINAQKAFDVAIYKGYFKGKPFVVEYGDGYVEATDIIVTDAKGKRERIHLLGLGNYDYENATLRYNYAGGHIFIEIVSEESEITPDSFECRYVKNGKVQERFTVEKSDYATADFYLNNTYSNILKEYKKAPKFLAKLKESQRLWIKYRDAELAAHFPLDDKRLEYGTSYLMCEENFLAEMTRRRTKELEQWLKQAEEGDVCKGSVGRTQE